MLFWMQIGLQLASAVSGIVAAVLWFLSATGKVPAMTWAEIDNLPSFLDRGGRLNRLGAAATGVSMLLSAFAMMLSAVS
jgi:hypothetical protein